MIPVIIPADFSGMSDLSVISALYVAGFIGSLLYYSCPPTCSRWLSPRVMLLFSMIWPIMLMFYILKVLITNKV